MRKKHAEPRRADRGRERRHPLRPWGVTRALICVGVALALFYGGWGLRLVFAEAGSDSAIVASFNELAADAAGAREGTQIRHDAMRLLLDADASRRDLEAVLNAEIETADAERRAADPSWAELADRGELFAYFLGFDATEYPLESWRTALPGDAWYEAEAAFVDEMLGVSREGVRRAIDAGIGDALESFARAECFVWPEVR
ncbi:MAG: hypothetical protein AAFP26_09395, partial [Planctomycetota bacterium]